jgi:hypothetical protein
VIWGLRPAKADENRSGKGLTPPDWGDMTPPG